MTIVDNASATAGWVVRRSDLTSRIGSWSMLAVVIIGFTPTPFLR